ncbi:hypothetical protein C8R45DRAFT_1099501 [Mycena sanguinolenta]|nr:hypothetical protein C8R45DRAFT_1099501 [Mycena sanguinolenta]
MAATPWFWYMVAQAWIHLPTIAGLRSELVACNDITWFIVQEQVTDPVNMEQLVGGVGGTLAHVGQLVVSLIDSFVPANDTGMDKMRIDFMDRLLTFVGLIDPALHNPKRAKGVLGPFGKALLTRNIIRALITAICSLSNSLTLDALHSCFNLLAVLFLSSEGYAKIPEAMEQGLLRALLISAQCPLNDKIEQYYKLHFPGLLSSCLVNCCFLSALTVALHGITDLLNTTAFTLDRIPLIGK